MADTNDFDVLDDIARGWNTDEKCPWCSHQITDILEYVHDNDFDFECPSCEKPIVGEVWTQFILQRPRKP